MNKTLNEERINKGIFDATNTRGLTSQNMHLWINDKYRDLVSIAAII